MSLISRTCIAFLTLYTASSRGELLKGRDIDRPLQESYDYIVVGCGISGLVVANRLSEDEDRTVLCIEAGPADKYEKNIQYPAYVGADVGGDYDWHLATEPQTQLDGNRRPLPQGKVLGGGSILNAMVWNRGGADDYDAWEELGNPGWGWEGMLPYFKKSETYTPPASEEDARRYSINYNPDVHGFDGPVQVSYPRFFYPQSANLFQAMNDLGLPTQFDPNDGTSAGPALTPTDIDPNNQTRSDARRTYFDPYVSRPNFHVITGQHVTRVLLEGVANSSEVSNPTPGGNENGEGLAPSDNNEGFGFGPAGSTPPIAGQQPSKVKRQDPAFADHRAQGVEFAPSASAERQTVYATREVIVAAGSLHSAQLMQLSGIGPEAILRQYNIPIALDLPGVGSNLQDHCLVGTFYPYNNASFPSPTQLTTNATYNEEAREAYETNKEGPWTAGSPNALAFNPLSLITNNAGVIIANASRQAPVAYLPPNTDATVVAGFAAQKASLVSRYGRDNVAAYEIINNNAGSLTLAVMHPFSRGTCYIDSADPFNPPSIDPRWLSNPVDRQVLIEALFFNRQILAQPSMQELHPAQFVPRPETNEAGLNTLINGGIRTEFHPSGTLAMAPLSQGGVVDPRLIVYGTQNLRVVDASIYPLIPAAHLQAVVYGVAEKAADIIKADNLPSSSISSGSSPPTSVPNAASSQLATIPETTADTAIPTDQALESSQVDSQAPTTSLDGSPTPIVVETSDSPIESTVASVTETPTSVTSPAEQQTNGPEVKTHVESTTQGPIEASTSQSEQQSSIPEATTPASPAIPASPAEKSPSIIVFTTVIPSAVPGHLDSLSISQPAATPASVNESPNEAPSATPGPVPISESVANVLSSAGLPDAVASSLVPIVVGSNPEAGSPGASATPSPEQTRRRAAIDAIVRWILQYFRSHQS